MKYLPILTIVLTILLGTYSWIPTVSTTAPTTLPIPLQKVSPLPKLTATLPSTPTLIAQLQAIVTAQMLPTPTPDASGFLREDLEIQVLLEVSHDSQLLGIVSTEGSLDISANKHFVAIYTYRDTGWQELDRLDLESPFWVESVSQVQLEPNYIWLEVKGKAGMRPDSYDLLSFDGKLLRNETEQFIKGMGHGQIIDINNDEQPEVVLDQNLGYGVLCGMCSIYELEFQVLRWDGRTLSEVQLTSLPSSSPAELLHLNNRAVELAQANLWKEARSLINKARVLGPGEETIAWNAGIINLYAQARRDHISRSIYPLLAQLYYGDYEAVLPQMRVYHSKQIFSPLTPLVIGTIAEYGQDILIDEIRTSTTQALQAKPDLAAAYFLRGWANYLANPADSQVLNDIRQAVELSPQEPLFSESLTYLQSQANVQQAEQASQQTGTVTITYVLTPTFTPADLPKPLAQNVELVGQLGGTIQAMAVQADYAYLGNSNGLTVIDIFALPRIVPVGQLQLPVTDIEVIGDYAFIASAEAGLWAVDVSDPASPVPVGFYETPGKVTRVAVRETQLYAYLVLKEVGIQIIDISNPARMIELGLYSFPKQLCDLALSPTKSEKIYLYLATCGDGLQVIDVSNPAKPVIVASLLEWANHVHTLGNYAYVSAEGDSLRIIDISEPTAPVEISQYNNKHITDLTQAQNGYIYTIGWEGLAVLDISDPANPTEVATSQYPTINPYADVLALEQDLIAVAGRYLLVSNWQGLHIVAVSEPAHPVEANLHQLLSGANNLIISGTYAYVAQGISYNSSTYWGRVSRVDISNPLNPTVAGSYDLRYPAYGIDTARGYLYITHGHCSFGAAACDGGVSVLEGMNTQELSEVGYHQVPLRPEATPYRSTTESWLATDIAVTDKYAYLAGIAYFTQDGGGLQLLSLSNPITPTPTSIITTSLNTAPWRPFGLSFGDNAGNQYVYLADYDQGLRIIDISNPVHPAEVGVLISPGARDVVVNGNYAYLANDYKGLRVIDISEPATPVEVGVYRTPGLARRLAISDSYIYLADSDQGLRIVDISDPTNPVEVGFYNTTGVASGVVLMNGIIYLADGDGGLLLLRFNPPAAGWRDSDPIDPRLPLGCPPDCRKVDLSERDLIQVDLSRANLWQANLDRANLSEANLYRAELYRASLIEADLDQANLYQANLQQADFQGASLIKANLFGADLTEAIFVDAKLKQAELKGADLSRANLRRANLVEAKLGHGITAGPTILEEANLEQADLHQAQLSGAQLNRANLRRSDLREADLNGASLNGVDLRQADLRQANLNNANLNGADLRGTDLREVILYNNNLSAAKIDQTTQIADKWRLVWQLVNGERTSLNLSQTDLSGANLNAINLRGADLRQANLSNTILWEADLSSADLRGANLSEARLTGAIFAGADLREANLKGTSLREVDLHGAKYNRQTLWPEKFDPVAAGAVLEE